MCIEPIGEFIAPFDIEVVKVLGTLRRSEWAPWQREYSNRYDTDGAYLQYRPNSIIDSPGGPGIHVYFDNPPLERHATNFMQYPEMLRSVIHAFIPRGTRVSYQNKSTGASVILAADTIVTRT